jgi:hypothetical protein
MKIKHCPKCGHNHTPEEWAMLEPIVTNDFPAEEPGEIDMRMVWRFCTCGNAFPIDVLDPEWVVFAARASTAQQVLSLAIAVGLATKAFA